MYDVLLIARYIIKKCNEMNKVISNLKLQKMLYFVQAEFLVVKKKPCFSGRIEAWDFGPVVPEVYHRYKVYGNASIPYTITTTLSGITERDCVLLDGIIEECSKYSAAKLVEITHKQAPWIEAYHSKSSNIITNQSILRYFSED